MKKGKIIQLIFGAYLFLTGLYMLYDYINIIDTFYSGIVFGEGAVCIIWGIREILFSLSGLSSKERSKK